MLAWRRVFRSSVPCWRLVTNKSARSPLAFSASPYHAPADKGWTSFAEPESDGEMEPRSPEPVDEFTDRLRTALQNQDYQQAQSIYQEVKNSNVTPNLRFLTRALSLPHVEEIYESFLSQDIESRQHAAPFYVKLLARIDADKLHHLIPSVLQHLLEGEIPDALFEAHRPSVIGAGATEEQYGVFLNQLLDRTSLSASLLIPMLGKIVLYNPTCLKHVKQILGASIVDDKIDLAYFLTYVLRRSHSPQQLDRALKVAALIQRDCVNVSPQLPEALQMVYDKFLRRGSSFAANQFKAAVEKAGGAITTQSLTTQKTNSRLRGNPQKLRDAFVSNDPARIKQLLPTIDADENTLEFYQQVLPELDDSMGFVQHLHENRVPIPVAMCGALLERQDSVVSSLKLLQFVESTYRKVPSAFTKCYEIVLDCCAEEGDWSSFRAIVERVHGMDLLSDSFCMRAVEKSYQLGQLDLLWNLVNLFVPAAREGKISESAIHRSLLRRLDAAQTIEFLALLDSPPKEYIQQMISRVCNTKTLNRETVLKMNQILEQFLNRTNQTLSSLPESNSLYSIYARVGLLEELGVANDIRYFNTLLAEHIENKEYDEAEALLERIESDKSLKPDYFTRKHKSLLRKRKQPVEGHTGLADILNFSKE